MVFNRQFAGDRMLLTCPRTQVDELAAFAAERTKGILSIPIDIALAGRTVGHFDSCLLVARHTTAHRSPLTAGARNAFALLTYTLSAETVRLDRSAPDAC